MVVEALVGVAVLDLLDTGPRAEESTVDLHFPRHGVQRRTECRPLEHPPACPEHPVPYVDVGVVEADLLAVGFEPATSWAARLLPPRDRPLRQRRRRRRRRRGGGRGGGRG